jgi:hypothetical protein
LLDSEFDIFVSIFNKNHVPKKIINCSFGAL